MGTRGWECTIAIVDDDAGFCRALARLVRSAGFEADTYAGGSEFLEAAVEHAPDCVILDLQMPGLDGFEVLARMRRDALRIPVVIVSGYDNPEGEAMALPKGASAYLRKPVDQRVLLKAIHDAIAGGGRMY